MTTKKRLIDADKFEKLVHNQRATYLFKEDILAAIAKQPTVDAVEVVRCVECEYRTRMGNCGNPRQQGILPTAYPYDFCSYGKKRC